MLKNPIDQTIAHYRIPTPEGEYTNETLRVAEIVPRPSDGPDFHESLKVCAAGIAQVVHDSWTHKFIDNGVLKRHEVDDVVKTPSQQAQAIIRFSPDDRTRRAARYFITSAGALDQITDPRQVRAVLRMETHTPRLPTLGNLRREPYPVITDLETRSGRLASGPYYFDAHVLVHAALRDAQPNRKAMACAERENPDGLFFLRDLDFRNRGRGQRVAVGSRPNPGTGPAEQVSLHYVHMETSKAVRVQDVLRRRISRFAVE